MRDASENGKGGCAGSERRVQDRGARAFGWAVAVAALNAGLMAALGAHPFPDPAPQLAAGAVAMGLHGWGAWEAARCLGAWARATRELAELAARGLREQASSARGAASSS